MAKRKNNRKKTSSKPPTSKTEIKVNPFEVRINRERHVVLGRKSKNDRGMPGVSRNRAIKRRSEIFKKRLILTNKSNSFVDKRIGEYDDSIMKEDRIIARLTQERRKKYKKNIYNLNDEEELTHLGRPVTELETFDNPASDSDDDAQLDADFVKEAHFGGFLVKKTQTQDLPKTHKEIIDDLIIESKRRKQERKVERDLNTDLTEKLDKEWKEVHSLMSKMKGKKDVEENAKSDSFDIIARELKFEPRGIPANRLKTKEELEKEEKQKEKKFEEERMLRMQDQENVKKKKLQDELSADSIYDGLELESEFIPQAGESDQEEDNSDIDMDKTIESTADNDSDNDDIDFDNDDDSDKDSEDSYSDLESDDNKDIDENFNELTNVLSTNPLKNKLKACVVPQTVEDFANLVSGHSPQEVSKIVKDVLERNPSNSGAKWKSQLENFLQVILDYIDNYQEKFFTIEILDVLMPHLYTIAKFSPLKTAYIVRDVLLKKMECFQKLKRCLNLQTNCLNFNDLIMLKICSVVFSTSDFRHPVVTPAMLFMSDILTSAYFVTYQNILSRLFICNLFFEYVSYAKRLVPEAIHFLQDVLYLASTKDRLPVKYTSKVNRYVFENKDLLLIKSPIKNEPSKMSLKHLLNISDQTEVPEIKMSMVFIAVEQLCLYADLYYNVPSFIEMFIPVLEICDSLPSKLYPVSVVSLLEKLKIIILKSDKCKNYLAFPNKKPKPLKLYEPRFESKFQSKTQTIAKKLKLEKQLSQKIKKEEKGIIREIRRDTQFMARQQLKEKMEADEIRNRKVNQIRQELSMQEGEYKKMMKKNT